MTETTTSTNPNPPFAFPEPFRCEACRSVLARSAVANHEDRYHDGAQTCWPVEAR